MPPAILTTNLDWTRDKRAVRLLASIAATPPKLVKRTIRYAITRDEWFEYVGYRVSALGVIANEYLLRCDALWEASDKSDAAYDAIYGPYNAVDAVQEVVAAAVNAPALEMAA